MLEHTDKQGAMKVLSVGSKSSYSQGDSRSKCAFQLLLHTAHWWTAHTITSCALMAQLRPWSPIWSPTKIKVFFVVLRSSC